MALVYDMLYRGALLESVPIDPYICELAKTLVHGAGMGGAAAQIECKVEPLFVSAKVATHLGLLINEALSHRLRQGSVGGEPQSLKLGLARQNGAVLFELSDNGPSASDSVGVSEVEHQILDALIRQLEGSLSYSSTNGFSMQIILPLGALGLDEVMPRA
jgi:two-component sensor histidine kinase